MERTRKTLDEIVSAARSIAESGVHLIDLTMGEDPVYFNRGDGGLTNLVEVVRRVRLETGLPVMVSPGVVPEELLGGFARAGADWYACYQETYSRPLFDSLRTGQSFQERFERKQAARKHGLLIEEGLLCGAGETAEDLAASLSAMRSLNPDQVRAMTYVPHPGTVLHPPPGSDKERELLVLAVLRLVFPESLIPASLDVEGLDGLAPRLRAGANVVTSLVPPGRGLGGVANASLDIEEARRTPGGIAPVLAACGLHVAGRQDYVEWMARRRVHVNDFPLKEATCGVAVAGGKLQGVEAAYLAHKAGWEVLLLDREDHVPASGLCDRFIQVDVTGDADVAGLLEGRGPDSSRVGKQSRPGLPGGMVESLRCSAGLRPCGLRRLFLQARIQPVCLPASGSRLPSPGRIAPCR